MNISTITESADKVLREMAKAFEEELDIQLNKAVMDQLDKQVPIIVERVKKQFMISASANIIQQMDQSGLQIQFTFKPKETK